LEGVDVEELVGVLQSGPRRPHAAATTGRERHEREKQRRNNELINQAVTQRLHGIPTLMRRLPEKLRAEAEARYHAIYDSSLARQTGRTGHGAAPRG